MATEEQKELAFYIKNVHQTLRLDSRKVGVEEAWLKHCRDKQKLHKYADAMQRLATHFWQQNNGESNCRIQWVANKCLLYFMGGDCGKENFRESRRELRLLGTYKELPSNVSEQCVSLLDVGSCYNPFKLFPFFKVIAIDLCPATPDVLECDFLNLVVDDSAKIPWNETCTSIASLPGTSFDVVVFSLLLEYFPSCAQRYICCKKAFALLKPAGLLFIISPDSNHASANAQIMKKWRVALGFLGFVRVYYEKLPHLQCMAFRRNYNEVVARHWAMRTWGEELDDVSSLLNIPQDRSQLDVVDVYIQRSEQEDQILAEMFLELPISS